jgi:branched-chain amino acid transport system ATP-binding protein
MLEVENVSSAYGMVQILRDVSFKVEEKEIVSIIGPNGAGKTTLVKTIMGYLKPKTGSIKYKGENIEKFLLTKLLKKA